VTVTVDHEPLAVGEMGLQTVGQVLAHLHAARKLVVQVLVDGVEPEVAALRQTALAGRCVFIETADPRQLAADVLSDAHAQLADAERLKRSAAELLQQNQPNKALEQLGGCVRIWQHAEQSVGKVGELLRLRPTDICVNGRGLTDVIAEFSTHLRSIKSALESRDFVLLSDVLMYETAETTAQWQASIESMLETVEAIA
jgi:hypothetical protein